MLTLAVESSCDETSAAVVADGSRVLSNVVASQEALHARYGGVVPELAARRHVEAIGPVLREALAQASVDWSDLNLVAVTRGPGLPGALLVGLCTAKAVALARGLPLVGVNHLVGHIFAHWLCGGPPEFPALALVVSGSHTDLALLPSAHELRLLGSTADDAAGEAFDKVGRLLGLPYPGGPAVERLAATGDPHAFDFPRSFPEPGDHRFSFSGLKTAVAVHLERHPDARAADVAASFQRAAVEVLATKASFAAAAFGARSLLVAGGVAANKALARALAERSPVPVRVPPLELCTDNAAMIGAAGWAAFRAGRRDGLDMDADPGLPLAL
jgi:N6-L-threonylcarbamoyladenine synthase